MTALAQRREPTPIEGLAASALHAYGKPVGWDPYPRVVPPSSFYWLCVDCPVCGRRCRAGSTLRHWETTPASFDNAEIMLTRAAGFKRLTNERGPLWDALASADVTTSVRLGRAIEEFFDRLDRRLRQAVQQSDHATARARRGR